MASQNLVHEALLKLEQAVRLEENQDRAARLESTCRALHQYDMDSKSELTDEDCEARVSRVLLVDPVQQALAKITEWSTFDLFELATACNGKPLAVLTTFLFDRLDFFSILNLPRAQFCRFMTLLESGYLDVPYHNNLHAADVVHNTFWMFQSPQLASSLSRLDMAVALLAGAMHDYGHPGTTNSYQVNMASDLALIYNDASVLENMHISESSRLMRTYKCSPFANLPKNVQSNIRKSIIKIILATDMTFHFPLVAELSKAVASKKAENKCFLMDKEEDTSLLLRTIVHSADIANACKPRPIYLKWTDLLFVEFLTQGDLEREQGLPISMLCDRNTHNLVSSQLGFFKFIVKPLYAGLTSVFHEAQICCDILQSNTEYWEKVSKDEIDAKKARDSAAAQL